MSASENSPIEANARTEAPYPVYRLDVCYFSGKLEAYLQYKEIPFRRIEVTNRVMRSQVIPNAGIAKVPVVQYRVWCRERLQQHFDALPEEAKGRVQRRLETAGAWEPLWRDGRIASHLHDESQPPVCRTPGPQSRAELNCASGWTSWNLPRGT